MKSRKITKKTGDTHVFRHLFIRGNYRDDIFFDHIDLANAWNRVWLAAAATNTQVWALEILTNHLHQANEFDCVDVGGPCNYNEASSYMHYLRMSLSEYFNVRHGVHGSLGSRRYGKAAVVDPIDDGGDDLRDLIVYINTNVRHHGVMDEFEKWKYSTCRFAFGDFDYGKCYTTDTLPEEMAKTYLPCRVKLPKGWLMTSDGMIVPPESCFPRSKIEALFGTRENYLRMLQGGSRRESKGEDNERLLGTKKNATITDMDIIAYVATLDPTPIPQMDRVRKKVALIAVREYYPKVRLGMLSRIFGIPGSTIIYWSNVGRPR